MRIPTHQRFVDAFGPEEGSIAYCYAKGWMDCRQHPAVEEWARQCYHDPRESSAAYAECLMLALDRILEGAGVEALRGREPWDRYHGDVEATYVNFGDTYDTTVIYDCRHDRLSVGSVGDLVERAPRRFAA